MKYSELVTVYDKLESTTKRLDKTFFISEFLKKVGENDLDDIVLLLQGIIFPRYDERKIGVAGRLVLKALSIATGIEVDKIEKEWKDLGDIGEVAEKLIGRKKQATLFSQDLTVKKVFDNIRSLAGLEGPGTVDRKVKLIAELLTSAKPREAKYIVRIVLEDMRVGVGEGSLRDALVWAYFPKIAGYFVPCTCGKYVPRSEKCLHCGREMKEVRKEKDLAIKCQKNYRCKKIYEPEEIDNLDLTKIDLIIPSDKDGLISGNKAHGIYQKFYQYVVDKVQNALDISNDFSKVAKVAKEKGLDGLKKIELKTEKPIKLMLFQKASDFEDAFERVGKPAAFEYKYDGFRLEIHKKGDIIKLFTRRLEDVSRQFPDVVELVRDHIKAKDLIIDTEITGIDPKTKKYLAFQNISQRIKRKYDIEKMTKEIPVMVNIFDVISIEGESAINEPYKNRIRILNKIVKEVPDKIVLAEQIITDDVKKAKEFYERALAVGNEGVMAKNLEAPYKPGSRVGYGVKIKPTMETLDLVIVGAEWGTGKRGQWLSSFDIACRDPDTGEFLEIGKFGTGVKEKAEEGTSFEEMTNLLKPLIRSEKGKKVVVKPKIVVEIDYEEIQKSPTYSSGFALRFPRLVVLREDKPVDETATIDMVEDLYFAQRGRK